MCFMRICFIFATVFLAAAGPQAAVFFPATVANLIADINTANGNGEDDTIFLGGLTFLLTAVYVEPTTEGPNGLPIIQPDGGHSLTIQNGVIERDLAATGFRLINVAPLATLFLNSVSLQNGLANDDNIADFPGNGGGALLNSGTLSLIKSQFLNNTSSSATIFGDAGGGAIYNAGGRITTILDCLFNNNVSAQDFGGAIINNVDIATGTILGIIQNIDSSTFSNNQALVGGGAIANFGTIGTIKNNTFSDNTAGTGGAIFNNLGSNITIASIQNSTFSGNHAIGSIIPPVTANGGAISNQFSSVITQIINSTFANNTAGSGGGIFNSGTINLKNTIIANSTGGDCSGPINAGLDSMADDNTCVGATQVTLAALMLGPLQNNSGPTDTIALGRECCDRCG